MFESLDDPYPLYKVRNMILKLYRLFDKYNNVITDDFTICNALIAINTGLKSYDLKKQDQSDKNYEETKALLESIITKVNSMVDTTKLNDDEKKSLKNFITTVNKITCKDLIPSSLK